MVVEACACGGGDVDAHVDVRGAAFDRVGRVVDGDAGVLAALVPADHQQLLGDEGGGQAVFIAARERSAIAGGVHHDDVGMFLAQPEEKLLQQLLVPAHGDARAQQRVDVIAFDVFRADAVDAPAPIEYAYTVLHEVDRGSDVGGDPGIGITFDDDLEATAGFVQPAEKTSVAAVVPACCENAGDGCAVVVRFVCIARVDAGAWW